MGVGYRREWSAGNITLALLAVAVLFGSFYGLASLARL